MAQDTARHTPFAPATPARVLPPVVLPRLPGVLWPAPAESATIDALFGTPVAAAPLISEAPAGRRTQGVLWDNVFAPLVAAAAGSMTITLVAHRTFDLYLPAFGRPGWGDLPASLVIASAGAALGVCAVRAFRYVHGAYGRLGHPMPALPAGGLVLGLPGALGGHLTLFQGLDEVGELAADPEGWWAGQFATMTVVKLTAMLVAAGGGRSDRRAGGAPGRHPAGVGKPVHGRRAGRLARDHRPAVHRLAAGLAAGDGAAADAVARRRNGGAVTA